jgi:hypothetical protein
MVANALLITLAVLLALAFFLMDELKFLVPYRQVLFRHYGTVLLGFAAALFVNVVAAAFALNRKFFLKDTGRKLSHIDKQFHVGHADLPTDLTDQEQ